jgi:hypothetical protein
MPTDSKQKMVRIQITMSISYTATPSLATRLLGQSGSSLSSKRDSHLKKVQLFAKSLKALSKIFSRRPKRSVI